MNNEIMIEERPKSSFSNFMGEARSFTDKKVFYQNLYNTMNSESDSERESCYRWAAMFFNDIPIEKYFDEDRIKLQNILGLMNRYNHQARTNPSPSNRRQYEQLFLYNAKQFYEAWNSALINLDLGLQWKDKKDIFSKVYDVADAEMRFPNRFGILISPQMEFFARVLAQRVMANRDNVIAIEGPTGEGKSTFTYALATTLAPMLDTDFDLYYNMIFNESKEYVNKLIKTIPNYSILDFDEAGNQLNKKTWWQEDQVELDNLLNLIRFHGLTFLLNWPDMKDLDKGVRDSRAKFVVSIKKRGIGIVRGFNLNPHANSRSYKPQATKGKIAMTGVQAQEMIENFDALKILRIPFYEIRGEAWTRYQDRKEKSLTLMDLAKSAGRSFQTTSELEVEYLLSLPQDQVRISWQQVLDYAAKVGWDMNVDKLSKS
jgi:hypothetical protein